MDREIFQQIWPIFLAEAREHLSSIGAEVLALEGARPDEVPAKVAPVMRTAHSLKGSAASLGLSAVERLAHALESALSRCSSQAQPPEHAAVSSMLRAVQAIEAALGTVEQGAATAEIPELDALVGALGATAPPPAAQPPPSSGSAELWGVFRADAVAHLRAVQAALEAGDKPEAAAQAAALVRVAELLALPGLQRASEALASQLEGRGWRKSGRAALQDVEAELSALDAGARSAQAQPEVPAEPEVGPLTPSSPVFLAEVDHLLEEIEARIPVLLSPDDRARLEAVADLRRSTHALKGTTGAVPSGEVATLSLKLHREAERLKGAQPDEAGGVLSELTGTLVELRKHLDTLRMQPEAAVPAPTPQTPEAGAAPAQVLDRSIRVSSARLDELVAEVEDLSLARNRLERRTHEHAAQLERLTRALTQLEQLTAELRALELTAHAARLSDTVEGLRHAHRALGQLNHEASRDVQGQRVIGLQVTESLRQLRTVPASVLIDPLHRATRDVAGRLGKQVQFKARGGEVRVDRRIVDVLRDPLLHLVRNAADHGIEPPVTRRAQAKPEEGTVTVTVEPRGHRLAISVSDDGGGLSTERIREHAIRQGVVTAPDAAALSERDVHRLIFRRGFSTAERVTEVSGRGVGLEVVEEAVDSLGGTLEVRSAPGRGTTFTLDLPQTLGATLAVIARVGPSRVALPHDRVERVLRVEATEVGRVAGRAVVQVDGVPLPFVSLTALLGVRRPTPEKAPAAQVALLLSAADQRVLAAVDEVLGQQELVIHGLGRHLSQVEHFAGAAIGADGGVLPVLHVSALLRAVKPERAPEKASRQRVLVVDDAMTTRAMVKTVLELAGLDVLTAADGEEALEVLEASPCQLVVSDVQMPRMDGLGLTRWLRRHPTLSRLPVLLVTSMDAPEERAAGMEAGADAYVVKRDVESGRLVELVKQLLPGEL